MYNMSANLEEVNLIVMQRFSRSSSGLIFWLAFINVVAIHCHVAVCVLLCHCVNNYYR